MSRAVLNYATRSEARAAYVGFDPDTPIAGHYRTRLRSGAIRVGVRIWHGAPLDPVTGEEMDRSHRWQAHVNGAYIELEQVWPKCADEPIDAAEYAHLCKLSAWADTHAPQIADPYRRIDPLQSPMMF